MDIPAMRVSFAKAAATGDEAPLYFYSHLFLRHPETRAMFPVSMAHQRDRLFNALGLVVAKVDELDALVPILQQLGRDHRIDVGADLRIAHHLDRIAGGLNCLLEVPVTHGCSYLPTRLSAAQYTVEWRAHCAVVVA